MISRGLIVMCPKRNVFTIASAELAAPPETLEPAPEIHYLTVN